MDIRALLEQGVADALTASAFLDVPAVTGVSDDPRPDRYVAAVCPTETEPRGFHTSLVLLELRVVAPLYGNHINWIQDTFAKVASWALADTSPLKGCTITSGDTNLNVLGSTPPSNRSEVREKQRAEIFAIKVACSLS